MTEQQIKHLRAVLKDSSLAENSADLDKRILREAQLSAKPENGRASNWQSLFGLAALQPAFFAVAITVGMFIAMSYIVSGPQQHSQMAVAERDLPIDIKPEESYPQHQGGVISKPQLMDVAQRPALSKAQRDQILIDIQLPEHAEILAHLGFASGVGQSPQAQAQVDAQQSLAQAMTDIRAMLRSGELDDARIRYAQLKESCFECRLPSTLEALVLNVKGVSSGTG